MTITGRTRYRIGWLGRIVLQVEEESRGCLAGARPSFPLATWGEWRDATAADFFSGQLPMLPDRLANVREAA